ncbi:MAG: glycosyltransferase family 87 protein [Candidatus Dormibacteraceae bacterium]
MQAVGTSAGSFGTRLQAAAANFLGDPRVLWSIAAMMAIRRVLADISVLLPPGADAYSFIAGGRQALSDPGRIYVNSAALIAAGHTWTITWPPPQLLLAVPFALLPEPADVWAWVITNALMSAVGLYLLYGAIGSSSGRTLPIFVLVVLFFTPLFEDIRLGQRGGLLLLLAGAAMVTIHRHPVLAGSLTGLGTSIKFYPAAMLLSVAPRQWSRFTGALCVVASLVLAVTFIPFGSPLAYATRILLPVALGSPGNPALTHDCFQNSTSLLFSRLVGGQEFSLESAAGVWSSVTLVPWHLPWLAHALTYLTITALIAGTVWAAHRSGWAQPYSMSLAFTLGALVPGDVYTYQFISVLPLTLVLLLKAIDRHHWGTVATVSVSLYLLVSSPCALVFPGLWTIAGLAIFGAAVVEAQLFQETGAKLESRA